ncbi:MAG TPA: hypothetical protein VIL51_02090, partial [Thermoleophilia bacterium]
SPAGRGWPRPRQPLDLPPHARGDPGQGWDGDLDEERLTAWMEEHLEVIPVPIADADTLRVREEAVLARLDPPLNLMHMPTTPLRRELRRLRKALND